MDKIPAIIVDIDGTIADISHRLHFIQRDKKDWDGFYSKVSDDKPIQNIIDLIKLISYDHDYERFAPRALFITGRSASTRIDTVKWLDKLFPEFYFEVYTREDGDHRQDYEVKKEIYNEWIKDKYDVKYVFEDRDQVVKMYRELGLTVLQVADGNF